MFVKVFRSGPLSSNLYLLFMESSYFVVDPCVSPDTVISDSECAGSMKTRKFEGILITHGHFDHIFFVKEWHDRYPEVPIYLHPDDNEALSDPDVNVSSDFGESMIFDVPVADVMKLDGKMTDDTVLRVIPVPGHSKGGVLYLFDHDEDHVMFSGDVLFAGSMGRTDLYGGDDEQMRQSLRLISRIEPDHIVFPGHGPDTTLEYEKKNNFYLISCSR